MQIIFIPSHKTIGEYYTIISLKILFEIYSLNVSESYNILSNGVLGKVWKYENLLLKTINDHITFRFIKHNLYDGSF